MEQRADSEAQGEAGGSGLHRIGRVRCATCGERFPADYAVCPRDATPLGVSPEPLDPLIGRILAGSYRITRLLAQGGMGRLYEAEHTRLPRRLAVKVIHDVYADNGDAVARFEREARAAALVDSDNVVSVVDVTRTEDDRPCIVYERLEGEDLQQRIAREGALPLADAVEIARQMARGLAAAHGAGIVHRDLKPSNVFLAARPGARLSVKLLDFGVAKLLGAPELTRTGAVVGTPAYMAPEQARGAEDIDGRADVYGLGAVLYKMLTGHAPFEAKDATASLTRLLSGPPRPLAGFDRALPIALICLVEDAMAREPRQRCRDAREVERRLHEIAAQIPNEEADDAVEPPANAEATAVMPRGVVEEAVATRQSLARRRPLAAIDLALVTVAFAGATAILARAADQAPVVAAGAAVLASAGALTLGVRRLRRVWSSAQTLARRHLAVRAAATRGLVTFGVLTGAFALFALAGGDGPLPSQSLFAVAITLALLVAGVAYRKRA